jgi:protein-L-isoaspartate(D-aspartate) O-methyltransferase
MLKWSFIHIPFCKTSVIPGTHLAGSWYLCNFQQKPMNHKPEDSFKHQGLRKKLIEQIKAKGLEDQRVLDAMMKVPRHYFFDKAFLSQAYNNEAFQIGAGQTISQPYTVAYQTHLLDIHAGEKVLEIGTGSGYQTCILLEMGAKVFTIERQKELYDKAKTFLPLIGYSPKLFYGDGFAGMPTYAPFDKVIITCGAPFVPEELVKQLKVGGIMVVPVGAGSVQIMTLIVKTSETTVEKKTLSEFRFVPMLENREWGNRGN